MQRKPSLSSTDDEIQSTPDYSSCDEIMDKRIDHGLEGKIIIILRIIIQYCLIIIILVPICFLF